MMRDSRRAGLVVPVPLWLTLLVLLGSLVALSFDLTAQADSSTFTTLVCRINVEPCQKVINIPEGETVTLDLFLESPGGSSPMQVAAWETHYQLASTSIAGPVLAASSGRPVQEQGDGRLILEGLTPLQSNADEATAQYYTVQNQYHPASGRLDYAVTLLHFSSARPAPRVLPFSGNGRALLGRLTLQGMAQGSAELVPGAASQAVIVTGSGQLQSFGAVSNSPLLSISVGPGSAPGFLGQIVRQVSSDPFPQELTVSFWQEGAVPPWLGGGSKPAAVFRSVTTDNQGFFRITDIPPSVLPPGQYDVRVQSRRALAALSLGVTFPGPGGSNEAAAAILVNSGSLRRGDIDGNNIVDNQDLGSLKASFGRLAGEAGFNNSADLNRDGVVDAQDFSSMSRNFNRRGE